MLCQNKRLTIDKGHNSVIDLLKFTHDNLNLDLFMVNADEKFDEIPSICFDNNQGL